MMRKAVACLSVVVALSSSEAAHAQRNYNQYLYNVAYSGWEFTGPFRQAPPVAYLKRAILIRQLGGTVKMRHRYYPRADGTPIRYYFYEFRIPRRVRYFSKHAAAVQFMNSIRRMRPTWPRGHYRARVSRTKRL